MFRNYVFNHTIADCRQGAVDFSMFTWTFGRGDVTFYVWALMFIQTMSIYPLLQHWSSTANAESKFYAVQCGLYEVTLFLWPAYAIFYYQLPIASSFIVACENVRLFMKIHSFVRETSPNVLRARQNPHYNEIDAKLAIGSFDHYLYFLFAPTLVYRTSYPNTPRIRWNYVRVWLKLWHF